MKNRIAFVSAVTVLATGMIFASNSAALPGATPTENAKGWVSVAGYVLPGVQSTQETQTEGTTTADVLPGVAQSGEVGSAYAKSEVLPGVGTASTTLESMKR